MITLEPIGYVRSARRDLLDDGWDSVPASIELSETFEPTASGCRLTSVSLFASVEDRDRWVPSGGLESGTRSSMALLDQVLAS